MAYGRSNAGSPHHGHGRAAGGARWPWPVLAVAGLGMLALGGVLGRASAPAPPVAQDRSEQPAPAQPEGDGPTRVEAGVPVGYARTEAGAVAAAAQYTAALDGDRALIEEQRDAVLAAIAAEDARDELRSAMAPGAYLLVEGLGLTPEVIDDPNFVARSVLAGYRVDSYTDDEATVRVWGTSMFFAPGRQAVSGSWSTEKVTLRWERDDWRLVAFDGQEGPAPPDSPTPSVPNIGEQINAFERFAHVAPPA